MALLRYLGGLVGKLIGVILIILGLLSALVNVGVCFLFVIIGIIFVLIGKFYSSTAKRYTPIKIEGNRGQNQTQSSTQSNIPKGKPCPDCGTPMNYVNDHDSWYCESCNQYKSNSQPKQKPIRKKKKTTVHPPPPPKKEESSKKQTSLEKLQELREMKDNDLITEEEFERKKKEILDQY